MSSNNNLVPQPAEGALQVAKPTGPLRVAGQIPDVGRVIARLDGAGMLEAVQATVTLRHDLGHIYAIPAGQDEDGGRRVAWAITAMGYNRLNGTAGVHIVKPPTLYIDGRARPNPFIERDEANGNLISVVCRAMAIGRAPVTGNLVATDQMLYWSPRAYFLNELLRKARYAKGLARIGPVEMFVAECRKPTDWLVDMGMGLAVVFDTQHPEFYKKFLDYQELVKFGERRAQTIVERNALKKHPAIGCSTVVPREVGGVAVAQVTVYGWRESDRSPAQVRELALRLCAGEIIDGIETTAEVSTQTHEEPELLAGDQATPSALQEAALALEAQQQAAESPPVIVPAADAEADPRPNSPADVGFAPKEAPASKPGRATTAKAGKAKPEDSPGRAALIARIKDAPVTSAQRAACLDECGIPEEAMVDELTVEQLTAILAAVSRQVDAN